MSSWRHWRIEKAEKFLSDADEAYRREMWETCVSRSYYAVFHLVAALVETRTGIPSRSWRHEILREEFEVRFCRRGFLFSRQDGSSLHDLMAERVAADYLDERFSGRRARRNLERASQLSSRLKEQLGSG